MRVQVVVRALWQRLLKFGRRRKPVQPESILIANDLSLGETLMLTPLLATLRARYPDALIVMTVSRAATPLYGQGPYGVVVKPFNKRDPATLTALRAYGGFDLAFVPGDNRQAWLAMALGARWIVAHGGDRPAWKNWMVDEAHPYPADPASWGDMVADLAGADDPRPYHPADWPAPICKPVSLPDGPYAVLHVGAGNVLKLWEPQRWRDLAAALTQRGFEVVWSAGANEAAIVAEVDACQRYRSFAEQLDLAQLWHLLARARLLICPDNGVAHLGRIVGTPTVALFGPGSPPLAGVGKFWRDCPYRAVAIEPFPCRDQPLLFKREVPWVQACKRASGDGSGLCTTPRCMQAIGLSGVLAAIDDCTGC